MSRKIRRQFFSGKKPEQVTPKWPTTLRDERNSHAGFKFFLFALAAAAWFYVLFFSQAFQIVDIWTVGPDPDTAKDIKLTAEQQKTRKRFFLPKNNIFIFHLGARSELLTQFGVKELYLHKNYVDRTVTIYFEPQAPRLIFVTDSRSYYYDANGQIIESKSRLANDNWQPGLPILFLQTRVGENFRPDAKLIATIEKIQTTAKTLNLQIAAYKIEQTPALSLKSSKKINSHDSQDLAEGEELPNSTNSLPELQAVVREGWVIHFGEKAIKVAENIDQALANLKTFVKNKHDKGQAKGLKYVDLRFGDRIYYK